MSTSDFIDIETERINVDELNEMAKSKKGPVENIRKDLENEKRRIKLYLIKLYLQICDKNHIQDLISDRIAQNINYVILIKEKIDFEEGLEKPGKNIDRYEIINTPLKKFGFDDAFQDYNIDLSILEILTQLLPKNYRIYKHYNYYDQSQSITITACKKTFEITVHWDEYNCDEIENGFCCVMHLICCCCLSCCSDQFYHETM
jgi:hypothetical protein